MSLERISYPAASIEFETAWNEGVQSNERAQQAIDKMLKALELEKYSRTKALKKIVEDHKHLRGFSRATLYRNLLTEENKRPYTKPTPGLSQNKTFKKSQEIIEKEREIDHSDEARIDNSTELDGNEPDVKASPLPYEVTVSGEWLWGNIHMIKLAAQNKTNSYFSIYNGEIVGFESASTRRNRKVIGVKA